MTLPRLPWLDIPALAAAGGTVRLPGSKSVSNRVLLLAALAEGRTVLHGVLASDDTAVMLDALRALGAGVETGFGGDANCVAVDGLGDRAGAREADLFLGNAGTAMRPLAAVLAVRAARDGGCYTLRGVARMHERPIGDLVDALRPLGAAVRCTGAEGFPPLAIGRDDGAPHALALDAPIRVRGDVSSQFLTALLLALPLAAATRDVVVEVDGELISTPYIGITLAMLERFGIRVARDGWRRFTIPRGSAYRSPGAMTVEADASAASYFIAAGAIGAVHAPLVIEGLDETAVQGDMRFVDVARAMGADVTSEPGRLVVRRGRWPLAAVTVDATAIPDAAMTLVPMALFARGTTRIEGIASWRVKETDRIAAMAAEARKLGARVVEGPDFLEVEPPARWQSATVDTYDDHRVAMCFSLAAFNGATSDAGAPAAVRIVDPGCVAKTFPDYFARFFAVVTPRDATQVPVITIDGPTASGKGTLAAEVAQRLGWHRLDSGVLYRATALAWQRDPAFRLDDDVARHAPAIAACAAALALEFDGDRVRLAGPGGTREDITDALRAEAVGMLASRVSALPAVRSALHALQLAFRRLPGLVADGRDMGSVVFPEAALKVFLVASAAQRAERRHKQLISKGFSANLDALLADLEARDARDMSRATAPLKAADGAHELDNSQLSIEASVDRVLGWWFARPAAS